MSEARMMELRLKGRNYERRYRPRFVVGRVTIGFISLLFLGTLAVFYITQTNRIATKGYELADLRNQKTQLVDQQEALTVEAARLQSIPAVAKSAQDQGMVPAKNANYVVNR